MTRARARALSSSCRGASAASVSRHEARSGPPIERAATPPPQDEAGSATLDLKQSRSPLFLQAAAILPAAPSGAASRLFCSHRPRTRGGWSADRRTRLPLSRLRGATPALRGADGPGMTGTPSRRSTVAIFGRDPRCRLRQWTPAPQRLPASGLNGLTVGVPTSRGYGSPAARGRHSSLRLGNRLRRRPS